MFWDLSNCARTGAVRSRVYVGLLAAVVTFGSALAQPTRPEGAQSQQPSPVRTLADSKVALQNGAFTSAVAIDTPAFRSITPQLRLSYSSSAGNGFLGVGWELSGFSTIERASPRRGSPRFSLPWQNDAYTLDGEALVASTALGGTHATLRQSFLRIRGDGDTWSITRPDGAVSTYSPVLQTPSGTVRWGLTKVQDTHGNVVNYAWGCDGTGTAARECYPEAISYANVSITLEREARPDRETFATGHGLGSRNYRLKTIVVDVAGSRRSSYALGYEMSARSGRSVLSAVQQFGRDGATSLPALTAAYSNQAIDFGQAQDVGSRYGLSAQIWSYSTIYTDDFNGDGRSDMLLRYRYGTNADAYLLLADGSGGFLAATNLVGQSGTSGSHWYKSDAYTADFNGDGRSDVLLHYRPSLPNGSTLLLTANASGGFDPIQDVSSQTGLTARELYYSTIVPAEFSGDGRADLLVHYREGAHSRGYRIDARSTGGFQSAVNVTTEYGLSASHWYTSTPVVSDYTGDGLADILLHERSVSSSTGHLLLNRSEGGFTNVVNVGAQYGLTSNNWYCANFVPGDFNGDGRTDLLAQRKNDCVSGGQFVLYATGATAGSRIGFAAAVDVTNAFGMTDDAWMHADTAIGDFNGDGRSDILLRSWYEQTPDPHLLLLSRGDSFANPIDVSYRYGTTARDWSYSNTRVGDYDGDGDDDVVLQGLVSGTTSTPHRLLLSSSRTTDLVTQFANGYGGSTTVIYEPSSKWRNTNNPPRSQTVSALVSDDGRGWSATTFYDYAGGAWDPVERRHLGFRYVKSVDPSGAYEETYFYQGASFQIGEVEDRYQRNAGGGVMTRHRRVVNGSAGAPWIRLLAEEELYECNGDATCRASRTSYDYDGYGNVSTKYEHGDVSTSGDERTTAYSYVPNTAAYLVAYPASVTLHAGLSRGGALLNETLTWYDGANSHLGAPAKGDPTAVLARLGDRYLKTTRAFDGYGNEVSVTTPLGHSTTTAWDTPLGLFPSSRTNALGQVTTFAWDAVCGEKAGETDPNGASTAWAYDALCRRSRETRADGGTTTWRYESFGAVGAQHVVETVADGSADGLWNATYFDGLGRAYLETSEGDRTVETRYDARGLVQSVSAPAATGEARKFTTFSYDAIGRLAQRTHPDGTSQRHLYEDWMTTTCDELGKPRSHFRDAYGQARMVREYLGKACALLPTGTVGVDVFETHIDYDLLGRRTGTVNAKGNTSSTTYDMLGRRIQAVDPDLGTWSFAYDDDGRLIRQTDAKQVTLAFSYDALARMTEKVEHATGKVLARYRYDEAGHGMGIGRRTSMSYERGIVETDFDAMGRQIEERRWVGLPIAIEAPTQPPIQEPVPPPARPGPPSRCPRPRAIFRNGEFRALVRCLIGRPVRTPMLAKPASRHQTLADVRALARGAKPGRPSSRPAPRKPTAKATSVLAVATPKTSSFPAPDFVVRHTYDTAGRIRTIQYPDLEVVEHEYDAAGRLVRVGGYVTDARYDARDNLVSRTLGNGVVETFTYDSNRYWSLGNRASSAAGEFHNVGFSRNARGEVTGRSNAYVAGDQWVYAYDDLRRLVAATATGQAAWSQSFSYDGVGRLLSQTGVGQYDYTGSARPAHGPSSIGGTAVTYDANGRMTRGPNLTISYDIEGNSSVINGDGYEYDGDGTRVRVNSVLFMGDLAEFDEASRVRTHYYYFGTTRIARKQINPMPLTPAVHYFHGDQLGSPTAVTDGAGNVVERKVYAPYGNVLWREGSLGDNPFGLAGQRLEASGLYHMNARKMAPALGVFTSPDPSDAPDPERPQTLNRFAYANNSPTNLVDPTGYAAEEPAAGAAQASVPPLLNLNKSSYLEAVRNGLWSEAAIFPGLKTNAEVRQVGRDVSNTPAAFTADVTAEQPYIDFVRDIASATYNAANPMGSDGRRVIGEKIMGLATNDSGEVVVTRIGIKQGLGGKVGNILVGAKAMAHVHYQGLIMKPEVGDISPVKIAGMTNFAITSRMTGREQSCCNVWEVGQQSGVGVYRNIRGRAPGRWMPMPTDGAR